MNLIPFLIIVAILSIGVIYGTDMFFAVVARPALNNASAAGITEVMGRLHDYGDRRMPVFGVLGILSTLGLIVMESPGTHAFSLGLIALIAQLVHLSFYFIVARPVNTTLTVAANRGETLPDALKLQQRWNSVILFRAFAQGSALLCLILIGIRA